MSGLRLSEEHLRNVLWKDIGSLDPDKYIIATYLAEIGPYPPKRVVEEMAIENSTGTWTLVKYETLDIRDKYGAKIVSVINAKNNMYVVQLGINGENYDPETGGLANLLSDIAGNAYDLIYINRLKLIDLHFPKSWASAFPGPKFGIEGIREMTGTKESRRPIIGCIMKPNLGLDADTMAKMAYEIASGGVDLLKDDEALVNPKYCPLEERVVKIMEALDKVKEETGKKALYAFNITMDRQDKMVEAAEAVKSHGGNHLMVCWAYVGYGGIRRLAEDPSINLPLHVHRCGHGALSRIPDHGIDAVLISKLGRMAGADEMHLGAIEGKFHYSISEVIRHIAVFRDPLYHFKPTLPTLSAGNHPGNVATSCEIVGNDVLLLAGGGIIGHPISPTAGAKAMMQAAEAYIKGIPVEEYAKEHKELEAAIKYWGVGVAKKIKGT
ncbi:MAG: RuBisCO large subunit C-terminal-like domain-containing protein [Candidatus Bathyarchaeia archaeon]